MNVLKFCYKNDKLGIRKSIFHAYNKGLISLTFKYMCMYACVYTIHALYVYTHTHTQKVIMKDNKQKNGQRLRIQFQEKEIQI